LYFIVKPDNLLIEDGDIIHIQRLQVLWDTSRRYYKDEKIR
jgi:hypothetical protein